MSPWQYMKLYINNLRKNWCYGVLHGACCGRKWKRTQLQRMFEGGADRLDKELDIVKLIKHKKNQRILCKKYLTDKDTQFKVKYDDKNIIDLDIETEDENAVQDKIPGGDPVDEQKQKVDKINAFKEQFKVA